MPQGLDARGSAEKVSEHLKSRNYEVLKEKRVNILYIREDHPAPFAAAREEARHR
jgi:hypothetical protein